MLSSTEAHGSINPVSAWDVAALAGGHACQQQVPFTGFRITLDPPERSIVQKMSHRLYVPLITKQQYNQLQQ